MRQQSGLRGNVWHTVGNGLDRGVEDARKAEQRNVVSKRRQIRSLRNDGIDSVDALEQPNQRRLTFEDYMAATFPHELRVPDKLKRIAQALFSVNENGCGADAR